MADNYGQMEKRVVFMENDHRHAQMVLKLKYLRLTQAAFFRHVITGLINDDPRIVEFTNEIALTSKTKKNKAEKAQREGQQNLKDYGFSEDDVDDIFDMIDNKSFSKLKTNFVQSLNL